MNYCDYCDSARDGEKNCGHCGAPAKHMHEKTERQKWGPRYFNGLVMFTEYDVMSDCYNWIVYDRDGVVSRVKISAELRASILSKTPDGSEISDEIIWELMENGAARSIRRQMGAKTYAIRLEEL